MVFEQDFKVKRFPPTHRTIIKLMSAIANPANQATNCPLCQKKGDGDLRVLHRISESVAHVFHPDCAAPWIRQFYSCPTCQSPLAERELVRFVRLRQNDAWIRGLEVIKAADENNSESLDILLSIGEISEASVLNALMIAAANGHMHIFNRFASQHTLSDTDRTNAFRLAGEGGHLLIMKHLLALGPVAANATDTAFQTSVEAGRDEIVEFLLSQKLVSGKALAQALEFAVTKDAPIVYLLLKFPVSKDCLPNLMRIAIEKSREHLVPLLLKNEISDEDRSAALWLATLTGLRNVVSMLLENGPILPEILTKSIQIAEKKNLKQIASMLQSHR